MCSLKEKDKTSEKELNKMGAGKLPDKEFKVMVLQITDLREEWVNSMRTSTKTRKFLK